MGLCLPGTRPRRRRRFDLFGLSQMVSREMRAAGLFRQGTREDHRNKQALLATKPIHGSSVTLLYCCAMRVCTFCRYVCKDCEEVRLSDAGYDMNLGRFQWQCKFCTRIFDDEATATVSSVSFERSCSPTWLPTWLLMQPTACPIRPCQAHGKRCAAAESRREWSCACNGQLGGQAAATPAIQCQGCRCFFHTGCKKRGKSGGCFHNVPRARLHDLR